MNLITGRWDAAAGAVRLPGENRYPAPPAWRTGLGAGGDVIVGFRPEAARIQPEGALAGTVYTTDMHGAYTVLHVNLNGGEIVHIRGDRRVNYPIGTPVRFDLDPLMVRFFNPATQQALRPGGAR